MTHAKQAAQQPSPSGSAGDAHLSQPQLNPGDAASPGTPGTGEHMCRGCAGTGRVNGKPCPSCAGTGRVTEGIGGA